MCVYRVRQVHRLEPLRFNAQDKDKSLLPLLLSTKRGYICGRVCLFVCLSVRGTTYKVINRFVWKFYQSQGTIHSILRIIRITIRPNYDPDRNPDRNPDYDPGYDPGRATEVCSL